MPCQAYVGVLALLMIPVCLECEALPAQQPDSHSRSQTRADVALIDQHGHKIMFYSDLLQGRVVAINTIFTTCTTVCPMMGARFAQLSRLLSGEDSARVMLISISTDPLVDTPERLDAWSRQFGAAGSNWVLLTGSKDQVDRVLKELGLYASDKQEHPSIVLIGNSRTNDWTRVSSSLAPAKLAPILKARESVEVQADGRGR